jgi:hypothetical protein
MSGKIPAGGTKAPFGQAEGCLSEAAVPPVTAVREPLAAPAPENKGFWFISPLKRWILWFLAFFGIYASSSVCPFCGTPGCPVGAGGAALVGGLFAAWWQYGTRVLQKGREIVSGIFR